MVENDKKHSKMVFSIVFDHANASYLTPLNVPPPAKTTSFLLPLFIRNKQVWIIGKQFNATTQNLKRSLKHRLHEYWISKSSDFEV